MPRAVLALLIALLLLLAACEAPLPAPTATPTPTSTAAPRSSLADVTPAPTQPKPLVLWLPDWMVMADGAAADQLRQMLKRFGDEEGTAIAIVAKPSAGEGGLLDFLMVSQPVAPAILPDLIALPLEGAEAAASKGLLQPLDGLIDPDLAADLYPFARSVARTDHGWYALPFVASVEHLAFQPSAIGDPPLNWDILLETQATYAFPAAGAETTLPDAILIHYLSTVKPGEDPLRNEAALRRLLGLYQSARANALLDSSTAQAASAADTWPRVLQGAVVMADATSQLWLRDRQQATLLRFGPIPTADSTPRYIAHGWAFAIISADEERQALCARLIQHLTAPDFLSAWSLSAHYLPARRSALAAWPSENYTAFAADALDTATRPPAWTSDAPFIRSLHRAALDVIMGVVNVETAIQTAVASW
jgi:ABC-type glycerol-3-phosphate transport system substrate-binding protein